MQINPMNVHLETYAAGGRPEAQGVEERDAMRFSVQEQEQKTAPERVSGEEQSGNAPAVKKMDKGTVSKLVEEIQEQAAKAGVQLKFKLREDSGDLQVEIVEAESQKVVRKIPPDDLIKLSESMEELAGGLVDRSF